MSHCRYEASVMRVYPSLRGAWGGTMRLPETGVCWLNWTSPGNSYGESSQPICCFRLGRGRAVSGILSRLTGLREEQSTLPWHASFGSSQAETPFAFSIREEDTSALFLIDSSNNEGACVHLEGHTTLKRSSRVRGWRLVMPKNIRHGRAWWRRRAGRARVYGGG